MNTLTAIYLSLFAGSAMADTEPCPPSYAQCGLGTKMVSKMVNGCPVQSCEARVAEKARVSSSGPSSDITKEEKKPGSKAIKDAPKGSREQMEKELGESLSEIDALINKNLSCSSESDCVALPIGHKLCGGPEGFRVASKNNPQLEALKHKLEEYKTLELAFQEAHMKGISSTCDMEQEPSFECKAKKCQVGPRNSL